MPTYAQNKQYIYNWREKNKEKFNENNAKGMVKYRLKKKLWKEIKIEFLNILII